MYFTVMDVAERYGVCRSTVNSWIESQELAAINISPAGSKYRRYKITAEALARFETLRASGDHRPTQHLPPVMQII